MTSSVALKAAPYGSSVYTDLRNSNFAYVDKTQFIETLENCGSATPFIVRPRRFGKTLFTETLRAYYDKAEAANFEQNFSGTYIGAHKTPLASQFYVLSLDFSAIDTDADLMGSFSRCVLSRLKEFFLRYPIAGHQQLLEQLETIPIPADMLLTFFDFIRPTTQRRLYIIIDEYDQFANALLSASPQVFRDITSKDGFLKGFYTQLKRSSSVSDVIARIFVTGVTSIALDSMTSGFSIAKNISSFPEEAAMFGFTDAELRSLVPQLIDLATYGRSLDDVMDRMKALYNGYRFSPASRESVFHASMCLYYLDYIRHFNEEPDQLLDPSVAADLSKIEGILRLGAPQDVKEIVSQAMRREAIPFGTLPELLNLQKDGCLTKKGLLSALFYLGYLTYGAGAKKELVVPNRVMAQQFFDVHFRCIRHFNHWNMTAFSDFSGAFQSLNAGDARPLVECVVSILARGYGKQKSLHLQEGDFQSSLLLAANLAAGYDYAAELEVRGEETGFVDLLLHSQTGGPSYLFELKYLPKHSGTQEAVAQSLNEAQLQAERYMKGANIQHIPRLQQVLAVFVGLELRAYEVNE